MQTLQRFLFWRNKTSQNKSIFGFRYSEINILLKKVLHEIIISMIIILALFFRQLWNAFHARPTSFSRQKNYWCLLWEIPRPNTWPLIYENHSTLYFVWETHVLFGYFPDLSVFFFILQGSLVDRFSEVKDLVVGNNQEMYEV